MNKEDKDTAGIWAEHLGDAFVGCYGLMDDLRVNGVSDDIINKVYEASILIEEAQQILQSIYEGDI